MEELGGGHVPALVGSGCQLSAVIGYSEALAVRAATLVAVIGILLVLIQGHGADECTVLLLPGDPCPGPRTLR